MVLNVNDKQNNRLVEYIDLYFDGLLSEKEMDLFEIKCIQDKTFFNIVQERAQIRGEIVTIIEKEGRDIFEKKPAKESTTRMVEKIIISLSHLKTGWKYALIPAAAMVVLFFLFFQPDSSFKMNANLDKELGYKQLRSISIEIISPKLGEKAGEIIKFNWSAELSGSFEVIILNNKGEEFDVIKSENDHYDYKNELLPGLYYWKLIQNGDWIYTGKFVVVKE